MKKLLLLLFVACVSCAKPVAEQTIEGPFLILSTPYYEDGSVNYENLVKEACFAADWDTPGVIWPQSNDAIDLLTEQERIDGMQALVNEWKNNPKKTILTLGVNGDDTEQMLMFAREAERMAQESGVDFILAARPPYYGKTEEDIKEYFEALATVAKRPVIIQTYVNDDCPAPSAQMLIYLAQTYPDVYGWIKEESNKLEANDRQKAELEGKPAVKTVFSAWGGWQWLYQRRQIGTAGLISEKIAYAPITSLIWQEMKKGDKEDCLTEAFAMYRLMIDQRFVIHDSLRGYGLYYLMRLGVFDNMLSRSYAVNTDRPLAAHAPEDKCKWTLTEFELTDMQKAELDQCYDDMMRFVNRNYKK